MYHLEASAIFYYHADYTSAWLSTGLGSNEIISDDTGKPHEFHLTLPFGETMAEQRKPVANYYNSWKFTGKELDEETGLYYFGARYYQPSWSVWLSVDPLAEEFPSWSTYAYGFNNPVFWTDPTGMAPEPPVNGLDWFVDDTGEYFWNEGKGKYEHYADPGGTGSNSFQGYYSVDEYSEPVGNYSIIFDLSYLEPADQYNSEHTIKSVAAPLMAGLESADGNPFNDSDFKNISDQENYPGVMILSHPKMNGAITLGNLIITNPGMEDKDVLDHEYGHYLDFKHHFKYDKVQYLKDIGYPSLKSAAGGGNHDKSTTERRANRLGGEWNNNQFLKDLYRDEK